MDRESEGGESGSESALCPVHPLPMLLLLMAELLLPMLPLMAQLLLPVLLMELVPLLLPLLLEPQPDERH